MRNANRALLPALLALVAAPLAAQAPRDAVAPPLPAESTKVAKPSEEEASLVKEIRIQHIRPNDQRGLNVFEPPKNDGTPFGGFKLDLGAAFTQQFQSLDHSNTADPAMTGDVNNNQLMDIGAGFNNATANLYLDAQLANGIRVALTTYLSSRHHRETWVKDGYLLIDDSPIDNDVLKGLMQYLTLRAGHFEVNYGDAHFRRTDNGQAIFNPFVGNLIMDAFTTEIGAEAYFRTGPFLAMAGITGGEIRGTVTQPDDRSWAYLGKIGFDQQLSEDLRVRLTGSMYTNDQAASSTLYGGDRAGSRYYLVLENTKAADDKQFTSGLVNPGFKNQVTAFMVNPFVKFRGLELFGVAERAQGKASAEDEERTWTQYAGDVVYRFLPGERLYVGGRYNVVSGELATAARDEVSVRRMQVGAGWFVTPSILLKAEYVDQKYDDFPTLDIRSGGKFNGLMIEGVVSF